MTSSRRLRITALAVAGLAALQLAWITVMVPYFGIDEFDHGDRASSVAAGHWGAGHLGVPLGLGRGDLISVRSDVAAATKASCTARPYTGPWNCNPVRSAGPGRVLIASGAARYNPTYYAVVGTVAKPWHGNANLDAMRAMTAVLSALLFGLAVWVVLGFSTTVWPMAALVVTALPTTVYSSAVAAPNGVEMFAGITLWACLISLFESASAGRERAVAYGGAAVAGVVVANTHTLGLLWCVLIGAVVALTYGLRRTAHVLRPRRRSELIAVLTLTTGLAFELFWALTTGVNDPGTPANVTQSAWPSIIEGLVLWPLQTIGAIPLRDDPAPLLTLGLCAAVLLALLVAATYLGGFRSRRSLAILAVLGLSYVVPAILTLSSFHRVGAAIWQGRYAAPFTAGAFLLAGLALDRAPALRPRLVTVLLVAGGLALTTAHLAALISVTRIQADVTALVTATGWSRPSVLLLILCAVVSGGCWWAAVRSSAAPAQTIVAEGAPTDDRHLAAVLR